MVPGMRKILAALSLGLSLTLSASAALGQATFPGFGPWTNAQRTVSGTGSADIRDCGGTIAAGGAASYTFTIGAPASFSADCIIVVTNTDAAQTKTIAVSGLSNVTLASNNGILIWNVGGTWHQGVLSTTVGGSTLPSNPNNSVQFNSGGAFGGSANLTFNSPTLIFGQSASVTGQAQFFSAAGPGGVFVQSPGSVPVSYSYNFPINAGAAGAPQLSGGGGSTPQSYSSILYPSTATSGGVACFTSSTQLASSALLTQFGVLYGGGAGQCPTTTATGPNGSLLLGVTGAAPSFQSMSQDCTITNAGAITCTKTNNISFGPFATQSAPCSLSQGCTGATTAQVARSSNTGNSLNIDNCTQTGSAAYIILSTDRCVYHLTLTGNVTDTLPLANSVNPGQILVLTDFAGVAVNGTKQVTVQRAGSDTINGGTSANAISGAFGTSIFWSDGTSKWTFFQILGAGTGTVTSVGTTGCASGGTITGSGTVAVTPATFSVGTAAQIFAGTANSCLDAAGALGASALLTLTDNVGATVALDFSTFKNASLTMTGSSNTRVLGNPSNMADMQGQCGHIYLIQSASGTNAVTYASQWKFASGSAPTTTTAVNSVDMLNFCVRDSTHIDASLLKDLR
jgi:hypothetical protein